MDFSVSSRESSISSRESSGDEHEDEELMLALMLMNTCIEEMKEQVALSLCSLMESSLECFVLQSPTLKPYDWSWEIITPSSPRPIIVQVNLVLIQHAKSFGALKLLAFGASPFAEILYFQMSERVLRDCVKEFSRTLVYHGNLRLEFLRAMTSHDAERVRNLHLQMYGVDGIIGGLDCSHMHWDKCPTGLQGQFKGKEKKPTIVLEGIADYNLWIWHAQVGYPGTLNDINILQTSVLINRLLSNEWCMTVDRTFTIGGEEFDHYLILVDEAYFAKWQEAFRKLIERAFGVFFLKFQYLDGRIRPHDLNEICDVTIACVLLHNMMVKERMQDGTVESSNFYYVDENAIEECRQMKFNIDAAITDVVPEAGDILWILTLQMIGLS
ncbi:hypothetical protein CTEN210_07151 [Chaetoceros tenuissimus]|uniref:DDE Tnp4 domain-containing protein n=1 Tax=Chaetoceros tenuissimus TaxID=426638 RepID=A0AAD3H525_9STRA|nr:hypothetical protein CTEN210_07151 [Chaetoceros tenuissimus]